MAESLISKTARAIKGDTRTEADVELDSYLDRIWKTATDGRRERDWKWYMYDLWVNGYHYAKWDRNTQQILTAPKSDGRPKVTINKIYTTLRGVRSYVLQPRPQAEVTPFGLTRDNLDQTVQLNHYVNYLHDRLHLRTKLRATMWHALKYSVGFWQVLYDDKAEDGAGSIVVNVVDPYDLYIDPAARYPSEARYMILATRRTIADLQEDEKYADFEDWDKIKPDNKLAASSLKERMMRQEQGDEGGSDEEKEGTVIVKEYWYKKAVEEDYEEEVEETNEEGEKTTNKVKKTRKVTKIFLCTKAGDVTIRKSFDTGLSRWPFFRLPSDIEPLQLYGHGWVKNLIPPQKLLNRHESSLAEYNELVNKGRYISDKGAGIRTIYNEHGQIIEKKRGYNFEAMQVPALNPAITTQIMNANRYIEDIGSLHDASLGRIPSGVTAGVAIEALQEGDSNNLSELLENTEEFLEDVFEYILEIAAQKYQFARDVITTTNTGEKLFMKVVGEKADEEIKAMEDVTVIPEKNAVDVKIGSAIAKTSFGRREAVKELVSVLPDLPKDVILDAFGVGPIADIVQKMREQKQEANAEQIQMQSQQQVAQAQVQQQTAPPPPQGAGAQEAISFIRLVFNGQIPPIPENVSPEFIDYIDQFLSSPEVSQENPQFIRTLQELRDQAILQMRSQSASMN